MIVKTQSVIHLKEGVTVTLLLTPALYGVAKERGIDLFKDVLKAKEAGNDIRVTHTIDAYSRIAYCAAIAWWEVAGVDHPDQGEFPYSYADFNTWAWANPKEFFKIIQEILVALTGKTAAEYLAESKKQEQLEGDKPEKKKTPTRLTKWLRRIGRK